MRSACCAVRPSGRRRRSGSAWSVAGAALRALGYARETPDPPGGVIERNDRGEPTGLLIATPSTAVLYGAIASAPALDHSARLNSTRQFMRELNRLGITSASDAGGGGQRYPEDYEVIRELAVRGENTVRIAYSLFTGNPGGELDDFKRWDRMTAFGDGDDRLKVNGIGELTFVRCPVHRPGQTA